MNSSKIVLANSYEETELNKLKVGMMYSLDPKLLGDMQIDIARELGYNFQVKISGFIWTQDLGKYNFPIPANWFESFKDAYFPDWLKRRFPVRYTNFEVNIKAWYPELHKKLAFPKEQYRFRVAHMNINGVPIDTDYPQRQPRSNENYR